MSLQDVRVKPTTYPKSMSIVEIVEDMLNKNGFGHWSVYATVGLEESTMYGMTIGNETIPGIIGKLAIAFDCTAQINYRTSTISFMENR